MLVGWLDYHRETLAVKCEGLTIEQLAERSVAPSTMSLLGLVRHLTEIERTYFRRTFSGEDVPPVPDEEDPFRDDASDASTALASWRDEVRRARDIIERTESLDDVGATVLPMRFWLVKTLNEYARHNGHADLLRERIDGRTGE